MLRQFLRALVRATHDEVWDPVKGRFNYYHRESETLHQEKPLLLGKQANAIAHVIAESSQTAFLHSAANLMSTCIKATL